MASVELAICGQYGILIVIRVAPDMIFSNPAGAECFLSCGPA